MLAKKRAHPQHRLSVVDRLQRAVQRLEGRLQLVPKARVNGKHYGYHEDPPNPEQPSKITDLMPSRASLMRIR